MIIDKFLEQDALVFDSFEDAAEVQKKLVENGYCVMMSREESFWLLNWVWTETPADRNGVIFINREDYEDNEYNWLKEHPGLLEKEDIC